MILQAYIIPQNITQNFDMTLCVYNICNDCMSCIPCFYTMHDGMHLLMRTFILTIPALNHDVVDIPRTAWRRGKAKTTVNFTDHFTIRASLKRFVSETPYLIHHTTKAPHITGCGVLLVMESLFTVR